MVHGLSSQQHDALCRGELLHAGVLLLAGGAQGVIGLLLLRAHVLPPLSSLLANDLHCHRLVWVVTLQSTTCFEQYMHVQDSAKGSSGLIMLDAEVQVCMLLVGAQAACNMEVPCTILGSLPGRRSMQIGAASALWGP